MKVTFDDRDVESMTSQFNLIKSDTAKDCLKPHF